MKPAIQRVVAEEKAARRQSRGSSPQRPSVLALTFISDHVLHGMFVDQERFRSSSPDQCIERSPVDYLKSLIDIHPKIRHAITPNWAMLQIPRSF